VPEPEETGDSFMANAELKARHVMEHTGLAALADDSGLVVPLLDGNPGIYSARWGGPQKDFQLAMRKVEEALRARGLEPEGTPAYFACALSLAWPDGHTETVEGRVDGTLTFPARGTHGFGYDAIFVPGSGNPASLTYAELPPAFKEHTSHRADAFTQLITECFRA
jgi:XTP/dITP diphosphohydrolase